MDLNGNVLDQNDQYNTENLEQIVNTSEKTYKIVGIIERPANNIEGYSAPGYTFITYTSQENIKETADIYVRYTETGTKNVFEVTANMLSVNSDNLEKSYNTDIILSEEESEKIAEELQNAKYQININTYLVDLETNPINNTSIGEFGVMVIIVVVIIVVTSVFCIKNSFDISITEKIKQYGMLRSIGATKKQIRKNVFYEASILGIIGIPLGIFFGFLASYILILISGYFLNEMIIGDGSLEFVFSFKAAIFAIVLGIITIHFSAFKSARRAAKVSPIDSIRNSANIKIKLKKIKSPKIINSIFGIGGQISYKNLKRNKKKYRTTVISIITSVAVFIALSSFVQMAFEEINNQLKLSETNIYISVDGDYSEELYDKYLKTVTFDTVENYAIVKQNGVSISPEYYNEEFVTFTKMELREDTEDYLNILSLGEEKYKEYIKELGLDYEEIKDKAILMDTVEAISFNEDTNEIINKILKVYSLNKGDVINARINSESTYDLEIGLTTEIKPFGFKYYNSPVLIVSDELFNKITEPNVFEIYYKSNDANKLQDELEKYLVDEEYYLENSEEQARIMSNVYILMAIFLYGFITVITLIGVTNIFNTITTNMQLRKPEFAILKSIGMTKKEFNRMIRLESLFMGLKSLIIGVPIGLGLSYLIYNYLASSTTVYVLPISAILISIVTVFILILIIMKYSINKINKQNIIETIRNENI